MNAQVQFGHDRYHQQSAMIDWCQTHIGSGGWHHGGDITIWPVEDSWKVHSMFGSTFFYFKHDKDATYFMIHWT